MTTTLNYEIDEKIKCTDLVLKVASRCNLNCTYCYMYNLGDNTYMNQPKFMSNNTAKQVIERVREHCHKHNIRRFHFVFHGGEPLLIDKDFYSFFKEECLSKLKNINVTFSIQTNGVLLDKVWVDTFERLGFHIGISLDGKKEQNDKHRVYHNGNGSYDDVLKGLEFIKQNNTVANRLGFLSVIDIECNPVEHYHHYKNLGATYLSLLLRDATHDNFERRDTDETPYADWLISIFNEWYNSNNADIQIQPFKNIIKNIIGGEGGDDALSGGKNEILVVETDGKIEAIDVLKICGNGFTKNNSSVKETPFDEALDTELATLYNLSHKLLPKKCIACPVNEICGGGYLPHRYSSKNGFNNPSVYCNDLLKLITHIQNRIIDDLPESFKIKHNIDKVTYEEALEMIEVAYKDIEEKKYFELLEKFKLE